MIVELFNIFLKVAKIKIKETCYGKRRINFFLKQNQKYKQKSQIMVT